MEGGAIMHWREGPYALEGLYALEGGAISIGGEGPYLWTTDTTP